LILSNTDPGQACTHRSRSSNRCRGLQRCRQPEVRSSRHRYCHFHSHWAKPDTFDQSSCVRSSSTLCACGVRRTTATQAAQRPSRSATDSSPELATALPKQHRAYRVCLRHLLRTVSAWWSAKGLDRSQYRLPRRGQLYFRRREDERRVTISQSLQPAGRDDMHDFRSRYVTWTSPG